LRSGKFCGQPNVIVSSCTVLLVQGEALALAFDNDNHGASPSVSLLAPWPHFFSKLEAATSVSWRRTSRRREESKARSLPSFSHGLAPCREHGVAPVERFALSPEPEPWRAGLPWTQRPAPLIDGSCIPTRAGRSRGAIPTPLAKFDGPDPVKRPTTRRPSSPSAIIRSKLWIKECDTHARAPHDCAHWQRLVNVRCGVMNHLTRRTFVHSLAAAATMPPFCKRRVPFLPRVRKFPP